MEDKVVWKRGNKRLCNYVTFECTSCNTRFGAPRDAVRVTNIDNSPVERAGMDTVRVLYHRVTECPVCFNLASAWVEQTEHLNTGWMELKDVEDLPHDTK